MLSYDQTMDFILKAKNGDINAKEQLITENENLIKSLVSRFKNKGENYEDLKQIAYVGFIKAINNFDISYGVCFSTYLVPMVIGEIKRFLRDDGIIKVSRVIKMQRLQINNFIEAYKNANNGNSPTIEEVSKSLNISEEEIVLALNCAKIPLSLYDKQEDDDSDNSPELLEKIGDNSREEEKMIDKIMLRGLIDELPLREQKIILLRFFRDKTQSETAKVLGISQVQVSRLESKIIGKLKQKIEIN
ncbi:MAG: SigB/SigF/SigG family RNA polymerase sigma factor [Clostridiales bacterium]|nr:SigB/SigF/SigG family RNA polymerase sigma factor [Clostridiales bacterium]